MVLSQLDNFMSSSFWYNANSSLINYGLLGRADFVPAGQEVWTVLYWSKGGVNKVSYFHLLFIYRINK